MKNICLFGGPSTGKSTIAAGLFFEMKKKGLKVEYVTEYAKDLVYSKDFYRLKDQLYILAKQHHPWFKLEGQLDFTINDGPFILGIIYLQDHPHLQRDLFEELIISIWNSYETINIFLERDLEKHPYQEYGRKESLSEALNKDKEILDMLIKNKIPYHKVKVGENTVQEIMELIGV
jgi:hypothetical protein